MGIDGLLEFEGVERWQTEVVNILILKEDEIGDAFRTEFPETRERLGTADARQERREVVLTLEKTPQELRVP